MAERIKSFRDLRVYQHAFEAASGLFARTRTFPREEKYSLTDQLLRSSRSVCANLAEAWRKRRYRAAFIAKLSDAESEAAETQVWLDFALRFGYLTTDEHAEWHEAYEQVLGELVRMIDNPDVWLIRPTK